MTSEPKPKAEPKNDNKRIEKFMFVTSLYFPGTNYRLFNP